MTDNELRLLCALAQVVLHTKRSPLDLDPKMTAALDELDTALLAAEPPPRRDDGQ